MKTQWCKRHGSNIGIGMGQCYYAYDRAHYLGPCEAATYPGTTTKEPIGMEVRVHTSETKVVSVGVVGHPGMLVEVKANGKVIFSNRADESFDGLMAEGDYLTVDIDETIKTKPPRPLKVPPK